MADERKIGTLEIDRLYDFLDGLQASGYTIDPRQYLALNDLLMALIAHGDSLDELPLKTMIAPLICSTPLEQQDFYQRFERWYATLMPIEFEDFGKGVDLALQLSQKRKWKLPTISRTTLIWALVAIAVIVFLIWLAFNSGGTATQVNNNLILYSAFIALFTAFVWFCWRIWIFYQENQYITRELAKQEPVYTQVPVKAYIQNVMPIMQFKPIVSALRKRTQVPSFAVDVDRTIENALNRNNWLEIVYRQRQVMPEYVVLIDRKSRLDQQARFVQEVLAKLAADGVWLHQYEFNGDPRICFPLDRKDTPLRLKDLQSRHPDSRLLIFSGTNELINPLTGLLQDWLESLSYWQERAILTPDKMQKVLLEELESRDFAVLPMTFDGLASLVRAFETDNAPILTSNDANPPAPLAERTMRWTGRDAPPETEVKALVSDVKTYLGENSFYWLCATAVYPELRWELTLHLGSVLNGDLGQPLLNSASLIRLARLPWFRFGYMPDWIRLALINNFTQPQEDRVRHELKQLLSTAYQGKDFDLIFSQKESDSLESRTKRLLFSVFRKSFTANDLKDQIFIKFVLMPQNRKLSIVLSEDIRESNVENVKEEIKDSIETKSSKEEILEESEISILSYQASSASPTAPPRILVVDPDSKSTQLWQNLLQIWGYAPVVADGKGKYLIQDALQKAGDFRCQLALVELRLIDEMDTEDTSGLNLIKNLKPAETVIMSGYLTPQLAAASISHHGAADAFIKGDDPSVLKDKLEKIAKRICSASRSTTIGPPDILNLATLTLFSPTRNVPAEAHDQILDVLTRLFPEANSLRLERTNSSIMSSEFTVPRPRSVVLQVYEDELQPVIVKIARGEKIRRELESFQRYIKGRLVGNYIPRLEASVVLWDIGGIKFSYIGIVEETFSNFVATQPAEKIEQSLEHFFLHTWAGHYRKAKEVENISLFALYCVVWDRDWYVRASSLVMPDLSKIIEPDLSKKALTDRKGIPALEWLKYIAENEGGDLDPSRVQSTRMAITHGDLHADNLLVDETDHLWTVDFERSGEGHILQDFISLECDLVIRIFDDMDFSSFYHLCVTATQNRQLGEMETESISFQNDKAQKLLHIISTIRALSIKCTGIKDARQYYLGLFFNAIFRATISSREQNSRSDLRAWMFASVLCHRLQHWDEPWPPAEWNLQ